MLVKNWMSKNVITVDADASMQEAICLLREHNINLLPVMENKRMVGIITDRDLKKASPSDATLLDMHELLYLTSKIKIESLMKKKVITVPPDFTIEEAAALLLENKISGLPVIDGQGQLVGVITRSDLFRVIISLAGLGKKGIQFAVCVKDQPGNIKAIREIIHQHGGRTASILTSWDNAPPGHLKVYFRIYNLDRNNLPALLEKIRLSGTLLYLVDHRDNTRAVFEA